LDLILTLTLPFFAVVGLGLVAGRRGMIDTAGVKSLNIFIFYFAMPALVVRALGQQPIGTLIDPAFFLGWGLAGLVIFAAAALLARLVFSSPLGEMAIFGQAASVGNIGFLALPLIIAAFGEAGAGPVAQALVIDLVVMIPLSIALLEASRGAESHRAAIRQIAIGVVANPFLVAIALGLAVSAAGFGLPGPLDRFLAFLGAAAGPAALFSLGVSLSGRRIEGDITAIGIMTLLKLVAHPLAVFAGLTLAGVPSTALAIGVVVASMPIAGNVFVIAQAYDVLPRRSSAAILISTILAVFTVAAALAWANVSG